MVKQLPVDRRPLSVRGEVLVLADAGDQVGDPAAWVRTTAGTASGLAAVTMVAVGGAYSSSVKPIQASSWSLASRASGWAAGP